MLILHHGNQLTQVMLLDLIFGTSLDDYAAEHNRTVPLIVLKCIEAVEQMGGLQKEGIYRISGRQSNVDSLKSAFEQNEQAMDLHQGKYDVTTIAAILKVYLRELKHPLFSLSVQSRMEYASEYWIILGRFHVAYSIFQPLTGSYGLLDCKARSLLYQRYIATPFTLLCVIWPSKYDTINSRQVN